MVVEEEELLMLQAEAKVPHSMRAVVEEYEEPLMLQAEEKAVVAARSYYYACPFLNQ